MSDQETAIVQPPWEAPIPLGRRLCWFDGARNMTIPMVDIKPLHTTQPVDLDRGWHATLPTENGAHVSLTFDPEWQYPGESPVTIWVDVRHPEYGYLIAARVEGAKIVYDPECLGGNCPGCEHDWGRWWHEVSSPQEVLDHLGFIGGLSIAMQSHNGRSEP